VFNYFNSKINTPSVFSKFNLLFNQKIKNKMPLMTERNIILASPFVIMVINYIVAILFGQWIGKWAFIPIILIEWSLFIFFIIKFSDQKAIKDWLKKPKGSIAWSILALFMGILPLPIFLMHYGLLSSWDIWLPWIILALINPWLEEFYWRGLLLDHTNTWSKWVAVLFTSFVFAANHLVFGVNSVLFRGWEVFISTFIMGVIWAIVYQKTNSLRWIIIAHFLVDFFSLSAPSFLELYKPNF
jgi:uncharacterized protein